MGGKEFHLIKKSEQVVRASVPLKHFVRLWVIRFETLGLGICVFKAFPGASETRPGLRTSVYSVSGSTGHLADVQQKLIGSILIPSGCWEYP